MLDDFREWLSDNLRYILLGLAVILILVIAFFAIRLVRGIGSSPKKEPETEAVTEDSVQTDAATTKNELVKESSDSELLQLVTQYYTAVAARDYDTLTSISESFTEEDKEKVESDSAIESYNNIITYSKKGPEEGTYIVYPYFEAKITGVETLAPSLQEMYVVTNAEGKLVIGDKDSSQELQDYILEMRADADVQALVKDVNTMLNEKKAEDADLAAYVESLNRNDGTQSGTDENGDGTGDGSGEGSSGAAVGTMQATTGVNVRGEASADSTLNGTLYAGMQVEVLENLDSGWSHIRYTTDGTTIEGYVMTQYLAAVQ